MIRVASLQQVTPKKIAAFYYVYEAMLQVYSLCFDPVKQDDGDSKKPLPALSRMSDM